MKDDFNMDDYLNDPDFEGKMETYKEKMIHQAVEANYENMKENGVSEWHVRHMNKEEMTQLKETLQYMTSYFLEYEEYEKCILLKSELEKVESILERVS